MEKVNKEKDRYVKMVLSALSDEIKEAVAQGKSKAHVEIWKFLDDSPMNVSEIKQRLEEALTPKGYVLEECLCLGGTALTCDRLCISASWHYDGTDGTIKRLV